MTYTTERTTYVINQPEANNPFEQFNNQWSMDLFSCCDNVSQCCYAYWCFCCFVGSLAGKINESKVSCCCIPNVLGIYRMKVRSILRIEGDSCNDYCVTSCCPLCAALQMSNELTNRGIDKVHASHSSDNNIY